MTSKSTPKGNEVACTSTAINNKVCAQCEDTFKKNQKSMNCNICKYWFCLQCSHVSPKLYELLKTESTPNLPFNCDGCVRVLPKLNELGLHLEKQRQKLEEYDVRFRDLEASMEAKIEKRVEIALESFRDREERKCNIIVHNIPEPDSESANKKLDDESALHDIFCAVQCEDVGLGSFIRLGKPMETKPRLVKLTLDSVTSKHKLLGNSKLLRRKNGDGYAAHKWSNIYITPDLTKAERDINSELRKELGRRKTATSNDDLVIFRGKIVDKKEISRVSRPPVTNDKGRGSAKNTATTSFRE